MVEIKEPPPKTVIAKPVASRPSVSGLKPFSELVASSVYTSPPLAAACETTVIRPRTLRFKPASAVGDEVYQLGARRNVPETNVGSNVVYKPVAKLVSKRTVSLLANLGGGRGIVLRQDIANDGTAVGPLSNQDMPGTELPLDFHQSFLPNSEMANDAVKNTEDNSKFLLLPTGDQSSYDEHSWRKYGQKHVKGSEYPRSYYKCTHPNCPVKKKVEQTLDGRIAEIVYSGEHNHSKPQLVDRISNDLRNFVQTNQLHERDECRETGLVSPKITESTNAGLPVDDPITAAACNASVSTSNNSLSQSGFEQSWETEGDEFRSKRTKREERLLKAAVSGEASSRPQTVIQNATDSDMIGDGFRWRKYGQKVVKGNSYPRSYYRCTSTKCGARKYVERTSEDPGSSITTYEGIHNHDVPIKTTHSEASKKTGKKKS